MTTLQDLAGEAAQYFESFQRNEENNTLWKLKDGTPEWVRDVVRHAHGDMFPDDWKCEFAYQALNALAEREDPDDARDDLEADVYTWDRLQWLSSSLDRSYYVDQAVKEFGVDERNFDVINAIGMGQIAEKEEVLGLVREALEERLEELEEEEDEETDE